MGFGDFFSGGDTTHNTTTTNQQVGVQGGGDTSGQGGTLYHHAQQVAAGGAAYQFGNVTGGKITNQPKQQKTLNAQKTSKRSTKSASHSIKAPVSGGGGGSNSTSIGGDTTINDASTNIDINDPATALAALQSNTLIAGAAIQAATNAGLVQMQSYNNAVSNEQNQATALEALAHVATLSPYSGQPAPLSTNDTPQAQAQPAAAPGGGSAILGGLLALVYYLTKQ